MNRSRFIFLFHLCIILIAITLIYDMDIIYFWLLLAFLEIVTIARKKYVGLPLFPYKWKDIKDTFYLRFTAP